MQFAASGPLPSEAAASACPAWLRNAVTLEVRGDSREWEAARDGLTMFFIGASDPDSYLRRHGTVTASSRILGGSDRRSVRYVVCSVRLFFKKESHAAARATAMTSATATSSDEEC